MSKKNEEMFEALLEAIKNAPQRPALEISNSHISMTDEADKELAISAGKLADALTAIANRKASGNSYGVYVSSPPQPYYMEGEE